MGHTTDTAFVVNDAHYDGDTMSATVMVKVGGAVVFSASERFVFADGSHVELRLMQALSRQKGGPQGQPFANVPANATIIFAANWSPCQHCVQNTIPDFVGRMLALGRNIQVKFRYREIYSRDHVNPGDYAGAGTHLWDNDGQAQAAYNHICGRFGIHSSYPDSAHTTTQLLRRWQQNRLNLVIAQEDVQGTSFESHVHYANYNG